MGAEHSERLFHFQWLMRKYAGESGLSTQWHRCVIYRIES